MINIKKIDHIGIRIKDRTRSIKFYENLGFEFTRDIGYEEGHPIMMRHPCGVTLNLLGPSSNTEDRNILMDIEEKHSGYTHIALHIESVDDAKLYFKKLGYSITGEFEFENIKAIFIRDPDRNVIEFDERG